MRYLLILALLSAGPRPTEMRIAAGLQTVPSDVIVGRAVCSGITWLFTDKRQLISIEHRPMAVTVRGGPRLQASDHPWGLACLSDGSLWTLAMPHVLAHLRPDGRPAERITLATPRVVLYGWTDRLLFIPIPMIVARPLLATSRPTTSDASTPWPRFFARATALRSDFLAHNLVNCGIGFARTLPCWFPDERQIDISDGVTSRAISFAMLYDSNADRATPIWDVAIGATNTLWLLVTGPVSVAGRKVGQRLVHADADGTVRRAIALDPPARTIVAAGERVCVLLTSDGHLMEVTSE